MNSIQAVSYALFLSSYNALKKSSERRKFNEYRVDCKEWRRGKRSKKLPQAFEMLLMIRIFSNFGMRCAIFSRFCVEPITMTDKENHRYNAGEDAP